ncbi:MAG: phenol hydroxylase subunit P4 [Gammaproteobacteria bacterium]
MPVSSTKPYIGVPRDRVENFNGKQLVYVSWDQHLLFAASFLVCVPPATTFRQMIEQNVVPLIAPDPDAAAVDWDAVQWLMSNRPFTPDWDASLAANGIVHKASLRMLTPGLNSLCGAAG